MKLINLVLIMAISGISHNIYSQSIFWWPRIGMDIYHSSLTINGDKQKFNGLGYYGGIGIISMYHSSFLDNRVAGQIDAMFVGKHFTGPRGINDYISSTTLGGRIRLIARIRLGNEISNISKAKPIVFIPFGCGVDYYLFHHQKDGSTVISNTINEINQLSITPILGLGVEFNPGGIKNNGMYSTRDAYISVMVTYNYCTNQFFNQDYVDVYGNKPYEKWNTTMGFFNIILNYRGFLTQVE